jgi:magnesium transporter
MKHPERQLDTDLKALHALVEHSPSELPDFLAEVHAADLADWTRHASDEELEVVFMALDAEGRAELFEFAEERVKAKLVSLLDTPDLVEVVENLGADEVVDMLAPVNDAKTEAVLNEVEFERAQGLRHLQTYEPDTAGGLMTTDFATVGLGNNVGDAIKELRQEDEQTIDDETGIFVVDEAGKPLGWISDRDLVTTPIHTSVEDVMVEIPVTVHPSDDQEEVAIAVSRYNLQVLAVVNSIGALVGVITAEDAGEVFEEEAEEDIRRIVGTSTEEQTHLPVLVRVRQRLPLQVLTVLGGLVTANILRFAMPDTQPGSDAAFGDLLRYVPIVIGLAGNVGIQAATILVRAFATGEVTPERELAVLSSEVTVGFLMGILCGGVTAVVAALLESDIEGSIAFGTAVGAAIVIAVTWSSLLGTTIPMLCRRIKVDPAVVAGPFMITLSDISGTAIFMLSAHLIMNATH